jgi:hypothetical protein
MLTSLKFHFHTSKNAHVHSLLMAAFFDQAI